MTPAYDLPAVPFSLRSSEPFDWRIEGNRLEGHAKPQSDIFISPEFGPVNPGEGTLNAVTLLGTPPSGDFTLQAKVTVGFEDTFDAGVLMIWFDRSTWAKLCFEAAPDGTPTIVSVVCRGVADDANAFPVAGDTAWLRVARIGEHFALHASTDGTTWHFVRVFALEAKDAPVHVGFEVQSPVGEGCDVQFSDIQFSERTIEDARDGS